MLFRSDQNQFNGIALLNSSAPAAGVTIQVGIDSGEIITVNLTDSSAGALGVSGLATTSITDATAALQTIDDAINTINTTRGSLGAAQNRLTSSLRSILNTRENLSSAESRIRDLDVAEETADLTRNSILQQAAVSILSQANSQPQIALTLLQG